MPTSRVLSVRLSEDEYQALRSMSMILGTTHTALLRRALNEMVKDAADNPEFLEAADATKRRLEEARRDLLGERVAASGRSSKRD